MCLLCCCLYKSVAESVVGKHLLIDWMVTLPHNSWGKFNIVLPSSSFPLTVGLNDLAHISSSQEKRRKTFMWGWQWGGTHNMRSPLSTMFSVYGTVLSTLTAMWYSRSLGLVHLARLILYTGWTITPLFPIRSGSPTLFSVSMGLTILDSMFKWDSAVFVFL